MHVAELRARGLVSPDALKASPSAVTKPGERFARCKVDKIAVCSPAAWRLYVAARLFTDAKGRLRVSRRYLADSIARTTRTVRRLLALLREAGITTGKRLFNVRCEKQSGLRVEKRPPVKREGSEQGVSTRILSRSTAPRQAT